MNSKLARAKVALRVFVALMVLATGQGVRSVQAQSCTLTVEGEFRYLDRAGQAVYAQYFYVELLDENGQRLLNGWDYTNESGVFYIPNASNPGCQLVELYVRTFTRYNTNDDPIDPANTLEGNYLIVEPVPGSADYLDSQHRFYLIPVASGYHFLNGGPTVIDRSDTPGDPAASNLPAFWIKDDLDRGFRFPTSQPGSFEAAWRATANSNPDVFCYDTMQSFFSGCLTPYILLSPLGPNSPDVVVHEMGHRVMYNQYNNQMPLSAYDYFWACLYDEGESLLHPVHGFGETNGTECTWTEDWPHFWAITVNNDPVYHFVNPDGTLAAGPNLENPPAPGTPPGWLSGDATEGWVASALWDIDDPVADGTDALDAEFGSDVWWVFTHYASGPDPGIDRTFAQYWGTWRAENWMGSIYEYLQCAATSIYQNTITYNADGWVSCADATVVLKVGELDGAGYVRTPVSLSALTSGGTGVLAPGGVSAFNNKVTYPPGAINVLDVTATAGETCNGVPPPNVVDNVTGTATFGASIATPFQQPPLDLWYLYLRLYGSALQSHSLTFPVSGQPAQPYRYFATGTGAAPAASETRTYRRGDGQADGTVTIADALFIAQYLVRSRPLGGDPPTHLTTLHGVNAASVRQDTEGNNCDVINIADALFIAQYLVGLRDAFFNLVGGAAAPSGEGAGAASATTVEVGALTLAPGGQGIVPITVTGITDPDGLGGYDIKITFNPQVINVTDVGGGQGPFNGDPTSHIDNVAGVVLLNATQSAIPGPTADIEIARLTVRAVGAAGTSTPLNLSITDLIDPRGDPIPATDVDGTVTIQ